MGAQEAALRRVVAIRETITATEVSPLVVEIHGGDAPVLELELAVYWEQLQSSLR